MRLPAWVLRPLRLMIIPILIATVHNEYAGRPQVTFMNSTTSLALPAEKSLLANTEFTHHKFPGTRSAPKMVEGSIFDLLLVIEICLIGLVFGGVTLLYGAVFVHWLWSYRREEAVELQEMEAESAQSDLQVVEPLSVDVPEVEEEFKEVLPKPKRRRKVAQSRSREEHSSNESNTESIAESGLDFASSSEHYEEEAEEEEEEEPEFRVRDPVMAEIFKEALMNARFDTLTRHVTELRNEMDSKDEQITVLTARIAALETQMEIKNDQICLILLFLVLYSLCNNAVRSA